MLSPHSTPFNVFCSILYWCSSWVCGGKGSSWISKEPLPLVTPNSLNKFLPPKLFSHADGYAEAVLHALGLSVLSSETFVLLSLLSCSTLHRPLCVYSSPFSLTLSLSPGQINVLTHFSVVIRTHSWEGCSNYSPFFHSETGRLRTRYSVVTAALRGHLKIPSWGQDCTTLS